MNEGQEGSKAMTIYILVCFVLAMGAFIGYKMQNDKREELSTEYVNLAESFADMSAAYSPNIKDYYSKVKAGLILRVDKDVRDNTDIRLKEIAQELGIMEGVGKDDHLDVGRPEDKLGPNKMYTEYEMSVKLKNVTQTQWAVFLSQAKDATKEYAHIKEIDLQRENTRFDRMDIVKDRQADTALWTVEIVFMWFGPKDEYRG